MSHPRQRYADLVAQLQLYLTECDPRDRLMTDKETYDFFVRDARAGHGKAPKRVATPLPKTLPPPPPPEPPRASPTPPPPKPVAPGAKEKAKKEPTPPPANTKGGETIALEKPVAADAGDTSEMARKFRELFPQNSLVETPPDDSIARAKRDEYRARQVALVTVCGDDSERQLLSKITAAVDTRLVPARLVNSDELVEWLGTPALKLVLISRKTLELLNDELAKAIRDQQHIAVEDLGKLAHDDASKRLLWKQLQEALKQ